MRIAFNPVRRCCDRGNSDTHLDTHVAGSVGILLIREVSYTSK